MENNIESPLYNNNYNNNNNNSNINNNSNERISNRIDEINDDNNNEGLSEEDKKSRLNMSSSFSHINIQNPAPLTIFLLINTMVGSGILNQPHVFEASGIIGGLIGFIIAGYIIIIIIIIIIINYYYYYYCYYYKLLLL